MTYNREFYTIFVVDTRSIRYFCGRKPNDIETDEDKEAVIFSLTGTPCTDKPVFHVVRHHDGFFVIHPITDIGIPVPISHTVK